MIERLSRRKIQRKEEEKIKAHSDMLILTLNTALFGFLVSSTRHFEVIFEVEYARSKV